MDFIGLDLGTNTLKAAQVKREGKKPPSLVAYGYGPAPKVSIHSEAPEDMKAYGTFLAKFVAENHFGTLYAATALPESAVFTRVVELPKMSEKEVGNAIKYEAEQYIPLPADQVSLDFQILPSEGDEGKIEVLLVAAPLGLTKKYTAVLREAGLKPISFETETISIQRSVVGEDPSLPPTLVTALGASTTDLAIYSGGALRFTRSISTGGDALTRVLAQSFGFELSQAEEYKKTYGLDETQLRGKVMQAIKPVFDVIIDEVRRSMAFYTSRKKKTVKRVILIGSTANLPGIAVYLAANLGIEVIRGDPWERLSVPAKFSREELEQLAPSFSVAVGLALKQI